MKKVVSATLAGALAVGMVPAMALADDAVELQAETEKDAVANGSIIAFEGGLADGAQFVAGSAVTALAPTAVAADITGKEYDVASIVYTKINATGTKDAYHTIDGKEFVPAGWSATCDGSVGKWAVAAKVMVDGVATWVKDCATFTIVANPMDGIEIYEIGKKAEDLSDTTFTFKAADFVFGDTEGELNLKIGGKALIEGTDYTVEIWDGAFTQELTSNWAWAGTYNAVITGIGKYAGAEKTLKFTVEPFDVAKSAIVLETVDASAGTAPYVPGIVSIDANPTHAIASCVEISSYSAPVVKAGAYKAVVNLAASLKGDPTNGAKWAASVINTQSVDFAVVAEEKTLTVTNTNPTSIDRSSATYKAADEFDASEVVVKIGTEVVDPSKYEFVVVRTDGTDPVPATLADLTDKSKYGTYDVSVKIKPEAVEYAYCGEQAVGTFAITNGTIAGNTVAYNYNGVLLPASGKDFPYDGNDVLDSLEIVVKTDKGAVVTDYTVVVEKKDKLGNWVEVAEAVDAGEYKITLKSDKYVLTAAHGLEFDIVAMYLFGELVDQVELQDKGTSDPSDDEFAGADALYTGEAIDPIERFYIVKDGKEIDVDVPAAAYKITITGFTPEAPNAKPVLKKDLPTEFKAAGTYVFDIEDVDPLDNYDVPNGSDLELTITAENVFPDVAADAWYADEVLTVAQNGWITGYGNGMFGPNDGMKRGDLAVVLARYIGEADLGAWLGTTLEGIIIGDALVSIDTGFSDVKGGAYYAKAIKAMAEAGIMTGYDDGTYGPEDLVTRQQLATILARLDASGIGDASILASALDAYADADEVAGWAAAGVEWAVENEIMGVNTAFLNPTDAVSRAEVAAMLLRYDAIEA